jgi:secreted trypsin-like serine protease
MRKLFRKDLTFLILLTALTACARVSQNSSSQLQSSSTEAGIIGGVKVTQETAELNGTVSLLLFTSIRNFERGVSQSICTGSLIGPNQVLTAAHCLDGFAKILVVFKSDLMAQPLTRDESSHVVEKRIMYPSYNRSTCESQLDCVDLAIVQFANAAPSAYHQVTISNEPGSLTPGALVHPVGIGMGKFNDLTSSGVLREGQVTLKTGDVNSDIFVLSQNDQSGICYGDSGGPLMVYDPVTSKPSLIGVASRSFKPGGLESDLCNYGSVATNVLKYKEWISSTIQAL